MNKPVSISFGGLLTLLFIGLKLTGFINWSWLWVLSPIWIPIVIVISILCVIASVESVATPSDALADLQNEVSELKALYAIAIDHDGRPIVCGSGSLKKIAFVLIREACFGRVK